MALADIKNFLELSPRLATAGQPTEQQVHELKQAEFHAIVNLGLLDPRYCLHDEAGLARSLGLSYYHIPVNFQEPRLSDLEQFFVRMDAHQDDKVFVHCAANYRVTTFVALYAEARWNWSRERADRLITTWWQPNEVWSVFIVQARAGLL